MELLCGNDFLFHKGESDDARVGIYFVNGNGNGVIERPGGTRGSHGSVEVLVSDYPTAVKGARQDPARGAVLVKRDNYSLIGNFYDARFHGRLGARGQ
jgi:hypothetical protein